VSNTASDKNLCQKIDENETSLKIRSENIRISEMYVHFHLSETVSDSTEKIGPYSLARVVITPKVFVL
jgi:hypothetical protein